MTFPKAMLRYRMSILWDARYSVVKDFFGKVCVHTIRAMRLFGSPTYLLLRNYNTFRYIM